MQPILKSSLVRESPRQKIKLKLRWARQKNATKHHLKSRPIRINLKPMQQPKWSKSESPRLSQRTHKTRWPQCLDPLNRSVKSLCRKLLLPTKLSSWKIKRCINPFRTTSRKQRRRTRTTRPFSSCWRETGLEPLLKREASWPLSAQHLVQPRTVEWEPLLSKAVWWVSSKSELTWPG